MKIVHLCLCGPYTDGFAYQENELVAQNVSDGHDVTVIASTERYGSNRQITTVKPCEYMGEDGAMVIRLPYGKWAPRKVMEKLRIYPDLYAKLVQLAPDVILFHGLCSWELLTAAKYKKRHPETKLLADCHEDFNNSAKTLASKYLLHASYYRSIVHACLNWIDMVLCVSLESMDFARDFYGIPARLVEFYPLGGKILLDAEYEYTRASVRHAHNISGDELVFLQSGKLDQSKLLVESLQAFVKTRDQSFRYFVVGQLIGDVEPAALRLIESDSRIRFLGWKSPEDLRQLLCASDVYVQPFGQSATMQMSLCCRCAVILQDVPSHEVFFKNNGFLLNKDQSLPDAYAFFSCSSQELPRMAKVSAQLAEQYLNYITHARRLTQ